MLADIRRASQMLKTGRRADALYIHSDVERRAGSTPQVQFELGNLCQEIGDVDRAIDHYEIAAAEASDNPQYASALGIAYLNAGNFDEAREALERALAIDPDTLDAQHGLGVYHLRSNDYSKAVGYLERACELKPSAANIRTNLATALRVLNRHTEALAHANKAVKLDDADPGGHLVLSQTLAEIGEADTALKHLERTIRKRPTFGLAYDLLARLRKFSHDDEAFIRKAEKLLDRGMSAQDRFSLRYALGKMHDDCGNYDEAFAHFEQANLLQKKDYDFALDKKILRDMKKTFTAASLKELSALGHESAQPVFIVGMPRSGTTLMERIIASHPKGAGAGELEEIPRIASLIFDWKDARRSVAHARAALTAEKINEYAESYLNVLRQGQPDAARVVDKLPSNFLYLGLIKTLFPNATIINSIRHPLDLSLSCYFQRFEVLGWANDLTLIGQVFKLYREAMEYWKKTLPDGSIVDIRYEQLVEDPETVVRRMLEACGLDWDPTVLDFHRKDGMVRTASMAQTRQPIYRTSRQRWMNYARHIGPLVAELAPYLDEDRERLRELGVELPASGWLKRAFRATA